MLDTTMGAFNQNFKNNNNYNHHNHDPFTTIIANSIQTRFTFDIKATILALMIVLSVFGTTYDNVANADYDNNTHFSTYVDSARFVQYLDENTALEEVKSGNLDMYYFRIASDRLETQQSRQGLDVFESTGGSYSMLVNPAVSKDTFNPLQDSEIRFAINYLVDRRLIVNELMGGYGMPIISHYGPSDPEYLTVIKKLAAFDFGYNPALAKKIISERLYAMGATKGNSEKNTDVDDTWYMNSEPITLTFFIRSDDPVRKSIGEILASEFEQMGFVIKKEFGDLNKAFVVVYGSDPADLKWHLYTEGWAKSAFVRYDSTGLAQMYSPWFSNMPGFNDPSYWNYENEKLDDLTRRIYTGDFVDEHQRANLIREAITIGVTESVRIFLASKIDQYVTHESISGVVNDFGAGLPSRFTPINARIMQTDNIDDNDIISHNSTRGELRIGVKQIYQGSWNPVMGFRDAYSNQIGTLLSDPATFKHPYTGKTIPVRATWNVTTAGPEDTLDVADDAILWNPVNQKWDIVDPDANATSVVVFEYKLGDWHSGASMDMLDIMHSFYFAKEWGTQTGPDDVTFDTEFTSIVAPSVETIKGIRPLSQNIIEVYVDYWHFDNGEIAQWAAPGVTMPWEIIAAMESAVIDGKTSFSRSGAASKGTSWLSVIIPTDVELLRGYLELMHERSHVPNSLLYAQSYGLPRVVFDHDNYDNEQYHTLRYNAAISWIDNTGHAMIGNGPFYLDSYSPESRSIKITSFDDKTYPFERGTWSGFERAAFPLIVGVDIKGSIKKGMQMHIDIATENSDAILYFLTSGSGKIISSGTHNIATNDNSEIKQGVQDDNNDISPDNIATITISAKDTAHLNNGANSIRIFALSDAVLKPDYYETGFIAIETTVDVNDSSTLTPASPNMQNESPSNSVFETEMPLGEEKVQSTTAQQQQQENSQQFNNNNNNNNDDDSNMNIYYLMLVIGVVSIAFVILVKILPKIRKKI